MTSPSETSGEQKFLAEAQALSKLLKDFRGMEVDDVILVRVIKICELSNLSTSHSLVCRRALDDTLTMLIKFFQEPSFTLLAEAIEVAERMLSNRPNHE